MGRWCGIAMMLGLGGATVAVAQDGPRLGDVLSIVAGEPIQEHGLRYYPWFQGDAPIADKLGGRACWRTDNARKIQYLHFRTDPGFRRDGLSPVQVAVTYLDEGTGTFTVKYDGELVSGYDATQTAPLRKTDTHEWKTAHFSLPDASLENEGGWRLWISSNAWLANDDEDAFCAVEVRFGGLLVGTRFTMIAADPSRNLELPIQAVPGPGLPTKGRDELQVKASAGFVEPTATLEDNRATVWFVPSDQPGTAQVTVRCGDATATAEIEVLPGQGPVSQREIAVCDFATPEAAKVSGYHGEATGAAAEEGGEKVLVVRYKLAEKDSSARAVIDLRRPLPGLPVAFRLEVRTDDSNNVLWVLFRDATGQLLYLPLGPMSGARGETRAMPFARPTRAAGGAGDGLWHTPVVVHELRVVEAPAGRGRSLTGEVAFRRFALTVVATESAWRDWEAAQPAGR